MCVRAEDNVFLRVYETKVESEKLPREYWEVGNNSR